jgi:ArsR family transcriptional regulator, arsenate/arsenite/antimonite-responsive transcriptional repressor
VARPSLPIVNAPSAPCVPRKRRVTVPKTRAFAPFFKALGDETRLEILALLASAGEAVCVCDIEAHIGELSQPTISHHLKLLREAGLVTAEKRGTWSYYTLVPEALSPLTKTHALLAPHDR